MEMFEGGKNVLVTLLLVILADAAVRSEVISSGSAKLKSIAWKPCKIPESDDHYYLSLDESRKFHPKTNEIEGNGQQAVKVKCFQPTKHSKASDLVVCFDGEWYPSDHGCVPKSCDPVYDTYSTIFTCTTPEGRNVSCDQPTPFKTQITIQCSHWRYKNSNENNNIKSCVDGKWEKWDTCRPGAQCGRIIGKPPQSSNAASPEEVLKQNPWHVVIYRLQDKKWTQRCVGTIINSHVIATAGSCFSPEFKLVEPESVKFSVGQYYKDLETTQSFSRVYNVHEVHFSIDGEIALIKTDASIEYSDIVGNACFVEENGTSMEDMENSLHMAILIGNGETGSTRKGTELLLEAMSGNSLTEFKIPKRQFRATFKTYRKCDPANIGAGCMYTLSGGYTLVGILTNLTGEFLNFIFPYDKKYESFFNSHLNSQTND